MKRTFDRTQLGSVCVMCGKANVMGINKPHSQKRTKRVVKPNIQSYFGLPVCTRCLRTMKTKHVAEKTVVAAA
jgi:ribosomal protein L28